MQALILWTHALAALLFGVLALAQARKPGGGVPARPFVAALTLTAIWCLSIAGIDPQDVVARVAEGVKHLGWLAFMFALVWRDDEEAGTFRPIAAIYAIVALVVVAAMVLAVVQATQGFPDDARAIAGTRLALRMMAAAAALVLVRHLHVVAAPRSRGGLRLAVLALAAMWSVDLTLYVTTWFAGRWPAALIVARGVALVALVPVFAVAAQRGAGSLQVSRTVAFQSLSVVAIGLYVALTGFVTGMIAEFGGEHARVAQTAFVFGSAAALLTIGSTPWLPARPKDVDAKHLFAHRYDYRAEWLRFTETLGTPGRDAGPLDRRVVKAVADLTDSPAGLLLVADGEGLGVGAGWNWPDQTNGRAETGLTRYLRTTRRIVELDAVRSGRAHPEEASAIPAWIADDRDAWAIVPLIRSGQLAGAIVLARPPVDRALDWEDFDLLGVAGRQVASYLAEDRAHAALADAERFDEFNRRFAFILHDLKNLVSQLTLVARNAERHADNPDFRADMVATLKDSSDRMNALLARLSQHGPRAGEAVRAVALLPVVDRVAAARRAQHPVRTSGDAAIHALAEPNALETLLGHLVQNAIEASPAGEPVTLAVSSHGDQVAIDVIDRGTGMDPAFVRDRLFKPFDSSKAGGFGIGAFEARQLAEAMKGTLTVACREGEGTRFRVSLPAASAAAFEQAA